jgi:4-hydroxyphenylacetate 3-monooxygenase
VVGDDGGDLILFLGTFPLMTGQFVAGSSWEVALDLDGSTSLAHAYTVRRSS